MKKIINGVKLIGYEGSDYNHPYYYGKIEKNILIRDCRELCDDGDTFEIIYSSKDKISVYPIMESELKEHIQIHRKMKNGNPYTFICSGEPYRERWKKVK